MRSDVRSNVDVNTTDVQEFDCREETKFIESSCLELLRDMVTLDAAEVKSLLSKTNRDDHVIDNSTAAQRPVDALASHPRYMSHIEPVWRALPAEVKGRLSTWRNRWLGENNGFLLCAGLDDLRTAAEYHRPVIFMEHGVGQSYSDDFGRAPPPGAECVRLILCPGPEAEERNRARFPGIPVVQIGAPNLDRWHGPDGLEPSPSSRTSRPIIALSFRPIHFRFAQEARSALSHYLPSLPELAKRYTVLGHGHPIGLERYHKAYEHAGIEVVRDFNEVLRRAELYAADNSSTLFEFASTGRPVVAMNAPWYRRDKEHGLRFWSHVPGIQANGPEDLVAVVDMALTDPPDARVLRKAAVMRVYCAVDGHASRRAASAISRFVVELQHLSCVATSCR